MLESAIYRIVFVDRQQRLVRLLEWPRSADTARRYSLRGPLADELSRRHVGTFVVGVAEIDGDEISRWAAGPHVRPKSSGLRAVYRKQQEAAREAAGGKPVLRTKPPRLRGARIALIYGRTTPDGNKRCCVEDCEAPVARGRRYWCGPACVTRFRLDGDASAIRTNIVRRDSNTCVLCGYCPPPWRNVSVEERRQIRAMEVDHILRVENGGTNDPANLRLLCGACHARVTVRPDTEQRKPS